jgi:hypothetical protein
MRIRTFAAAFSLVAILGASSPAAAQYVARPYGASDAATGEKYHVEVGGDLWSPSPQMTISSESLGILGNDIDFVTDLGIERATFKQLKVVLRPTTKSKFRFEYTPITYTAEHTLTRSFVFNGQSFTVGLPVSTDVTWKAYRFGYEWDFVYRDRGFVGMLLDLKYTDINAELTANVIGTEFTHARAPIPAIGVIGRVYPAPNISITGEFSGFSWNRDAVIKGDDYGGRYFDFDLYGTVNFTDHFGAQVGYRSFDVFYKVKDDNGTMTLKGLYFGGVARF